MRVEACQDPGLPLAEGDSSSLKSLTDKALSGDWLSDSLALLSQGRAEQFTMQTNSLKRSAKALREFREKLDELRAEQEQKAEDAESWGCFGKIVAVASSAVAAVVGIYNPPAGKVIALAGSALAQSCMITGHAYGDQAAATQARALKTESLHADAAQDRGHRMQLLNDMIDHEQVMGRRLLALVQADAQSVNAAIKLGGTR